jgi:pyruvate,water dikinase
MGLSPIFIANMTTPDDLPAMRKSAAVLTSKGGPTCHAAIVCRALNIPCVTNVRDLQVNDSKEVVVRLAGQRHTFHCGDKITIGLIHITLELKGESTHDRKD